jgi:hypothetical protein
VSIIKQFAGVVVFHGSTDLSFKIIYVRQTSQIFSVSGLFLSADDGNHSAKGVICEASDKSDLGYVKNKKGRHSSEYQPFVNFLRSP